MSNTLNLLRNVTAQLAVNQPGSSTTGTPENKGKGLLHYNATSNGIARLAQVQIKNSFSSKRLAERGINTQNVISREGMKAVFGKTGVMSNIKDGLRRLSYRLGHHNEKASSGVGSIQRSLIRLAGDYHELSNQANAGNLESRKQLLNQIYDKVQELVDKHSFIRGKSERERRVDAKLMLNFLSNETLVIDQPNTEVLPIDQPNAEVLPSPPEAPLRPNPPELTSYNGNIISRGNRLEEVISHLKPEAPTLPDLPQLKPYTGNVGNKGSTLGEVMTNLGLTANEIKSRPEPPPLPEVSVPKYYTGNVVSRDGSLEEIIQNLRPEAPDLPETPALKPYEGKVASKGGSLEEVMKNLQKPEERKEISSLPWAKKQFEQNSIGDLGVLSGPRLRPDPKPSATLTDVTLKDLPGFSLRSQAYRDLEPGLLQALRVSGDNTEGLTKEGKLLGQLLGQCIVEHLSHLGPEESRLFQTALVTSDRNSIMAPVLQKLGDSFPQYKDNFQSLDYTYSQVTTLFESAYAEMLSLLPSHGDESGENITLDGVKYKLSKNLGEGSLGSVAIYEKAENQPNDAPQQIVVKRSLDENPDNVRHHRQAFSTMSKEIRSHALVGSHPNMVGFRGAVQTPNGSLLLAMDFAPLGDGHKLANKLGEAVKKGLISHESANAVRVTLLKDMVQGLSYLQEEKGMVHVDLKLQNFFIQKDGLAQMGDFGLTETSLNPEVVNLRLDAAYNKAPELSVQSTAQSRRVALIKDHSKENMTAKEKEKVSQSAEKERELHSFKFDEKVDVFALGTAAYELFTGRQFQQDLLRSGNWFSPEEALFDFGMDSSRTVTTLGMDGEGQNAQIVGRGVTAVDRLLNLMLHPDSSQRPRMNDLLQLGLFKQNGIGSTEVRNLVKLLMDPTTTPEALQNASSQIGI